MPQSSMQLTLEGGRSRFSAPPSRAELQRQGATFVKIPRALFQDLHALCEASKRGALLEGGDAHFHDMLHALSLQVQQGQLGRHAE